ncbi:MAG TPA: DUF4124 domain-containing protein [Casimicrobiaceae bacterium]|nr:DUF4124 domain-containing protein [Casimicrobiaceae bacterium]
MTRRSTSWDVALALCLALCAATSKAQVYKCQDATGKTFYADAPCTAGAKPLPLPSTTKQGSANPTACTQLLDETRRLAADAERDTKRGSAATAAAKRRKALEAEYHRRCAGISKSPR